MWNSDANQPVRAIADGKVIYAQLVIKSNGQVSSWGKLVVIEHDDGMISRCGHLRKMLVKVGDIVKKGQQIGTVGGTEYGLPDHKHIDISHSGILKTNPTYWPGDNLAAVLQHFVDPKKWIEEHRGEVEPPDPPPPPTGNAQLGLHASADPGDLSAAEIQEFKAAKPGVIKVLSAHAGPSIAALANQHLGIPFIIRAFLDFGGRVITPQQFFDDTISDTKRAVDAIGSGREIWVELHNEPNLTSEGLGASWADGAGFNSWLLAVLALYKAALPAVKYIYPGLSPQFTGYRPFLNASLQAAAACDGVGVHCYWSNDYSMNQSLVDTVDWYKGVFGNRPLWVTEASHNKPGVTASQKGLQYITFWNELKKRPSVKGVCYFVASASNPAFGWGSGGSCETWLGQGIAAVVGAR